MKNTDLDEVTGNATAAIERALASTYGAPKPAVTEHTVSVPHRVQVTHHPDGTTTRRDMGATDEKSRCTKF